MTMTADPPVRADGRCAVCGGERTPPAKQHKTATLEAERDPFCSATCAREFHGAPISADTSLSGEGHPTYYYDAMHVRRRTRQQERRANA
jgi:hypothetical protein